MIIIELFKIRPSDWNKMKKKLVFLNLNLALVDVENIMVLDSFFYIWI